jgi:hypothetical protein
LEAESAAQGRARRQRVVFAAQGGRDGYPKDMPGLELGRRLRTTSTIESDRLATFMNVTFDRRGRAVPNEVRSSLGDHLTPEFAAIGTSSDTAGPSRGGAQGVGGRARRRRPAGLSPRKELGGRDATFTAHLFFNEEYAEAGAPIRCGFFGEQVLGPTIGTPLPRAAGAALLDGNEWRIKGKKVSTSRAMDIDGAESLVEGRPSVDDVRYSFLFSRFHTIYAGCHEIERNSIVDRHKEPS